MVAQFSPVSHSLTHIHCPAYPTDVATKTIRVKLQITEYFLPTYWTDLWLVDEFMRELQRPAPSGFSRRVVPMRQPRISIG